MAKFEEDKPYLHSRQYRLDINTLGPRQHDSHFRDDIFKWIFLNENVWISIEISLKLVPSVPNNSIPALVHIMAWWLTGDKPVSEPMPVCLLTHICITRHEWVKRNSSRVRSPRQCLLFHCCHSFSKLSKHSSYLLNTTYLTGVAVVGLWRHCGVNYECNF